MSVQGEKFHKLLLKPALPDLSNIHENRIQTFQNAREYYESASDIDKQKIRTYVQNNSCILQIVIVSGIIENVKYLYEVMGVDLAMDNNIALTQAWKTSNSDICIWLLQIIGRHNIKTIFIRKLIKYAIKKCLRHMLDIAYEYLNEDLKSTILICQFDSNTNFIASTVVSWIQHNIPELQPQYESVNSYNICIRFEIRHIPEIVDIAECPVCLINTIKGHILHANHVICTLCYERLYNYGLHDCPLCRNPNVII